MFDELIAQNGTKFLIAAAAVAIGLICLALVLWIVRGRPSSPFIRGGRNRQPRLAVLDAAAVDTRRRLVLVRRDDVEHLVMIGGPTDIVIESRIVTSRASEAMPAEAPAPASREIAATPVPAAGAAPVEPAAKPISAPPSPQAPPAAPARSPSATVESAPTASPEGVSGMSKVLYAGDADARVSAVRTVQPAAREQAAQPPQPGVRQMPVRLPSPNQSVSPPTNPAERQAQDALEEARHRVLSNPTAASSIPDRAAASGVASAPAGDNAALVSEFEKILEAEMASTPAARVAPVPANAPRLEVKSGEQGDAPQKTREETEAEMARLLGEISANRRG
ncbi:MAG: flagellar biosynthetic protein FliO [Shinella sp.]|nr:flagellar biosynthetic protein FliO [Shinella sp.]